MHHPTMKAASRKMPSTRIHRLCNFAGAIGGGARKKIPSASRCAPGPLSHIHRQILNLTAAKSATGHSCAEAALKAVGQVGHQVQFFATYFVIVAQAGV